jgi:hypothetical protein
MRKATWGAIALAVAALHFGSPLREALLLRPMFGLATLAGYLLLSFDPPVQDARGYRRFLIGGIVASIAAFIVGVSQALYPWDVLARFLGVAAVALPLWVVARPPQFLFVAAAALALATAIPALDAAGGYATSLHAYLLVAGALVAAWLIHKPSAIPGQKRPPRIVTAHDVVFLSPQEKAERIARLEKRFQAGEIAEHKYWDLRQEIESR